MKKTFETLPGPNCLKSVGGSACKFLEPTITVLFPDNEFPIGGGLQASKDRVSLFKDCLSSRPTLCSNSCFLSATFGTAFLSDNL